MPQGGIAHKTTPPVALAYFFFSAGAPPGGGQSPAAPRRSRMAMGVPGVSPWTSRPSAVNLDGMDELKRCVGITPAVLAGAFFALCALGGFVFAYDFASRGIAFILGGVIW